MDRGNCVYVMTYGPMDHKIGISVSPPYRLTQLRGGGAAAVVHVWMRTGDDAQRIEAIAHRVLAPWRHAITGQRERFHCSARAACHAVELAIVLAGEEAADRVMREAARAAALEDAGPKRLVPLPGHGRHIGYVLRRDAPAASAESDALVRAGVDVPDLFVDVGRPGKGLARALATLEEGFSLVVAAPDRLDAAARAAVAAAGATVHEMAA